MDKIILLKKWIADSNAIVAITGAGFSTDSGIPDFRGANGIYSDAKDYGFPPETIVSRDFFYKEPDVFYDFCRNELVHEEARPNGAHRALFELESQGKLKAIVTQNVDGLHQMAGNTLVIELHGSVSDYYCTACGLYHPLSYVMATNKAPMCLECDSLLKPDAVLFGEMLNPNRFTDAKNAISKADLLIIAGTSLTVNTAAKLIQFFKGKNLVIINDSKTPYDSKANLVIHERLELAFNTLLTP